MIFSKKDTTQPKVGKDAEPPKLSSDQTWPFNTDSAVIDGIAQPGENVAVMLLDVTGLDWAEIEPLLDVARGVAKERGAVPVLIVDMLDFTGLRSSGFAYDVLPNAAANAEFYPQHDWRAYLEQRRFLLTQKWQPIAIVHLSNRSEGWG